MVFCDLHCSILLKSRRPQWTGHLTIMGETKNIYKNFLGKPVGKLSLGRPRRKWKHNIKMYAGKEIVRMERE